MSERLKTHSPIEDALLDAFMSIGDDRVRFSRAKSLDTFVRTLATDWESKRVFVASQVVIGAYRVDFRAAHHFDARLPALQPRDGID